MKTEVDQHISIVPGDMLKLTIPFPVRQETGNGIIHAYLWIIIAKTRKWKLTNMFFSPWGYFNINTSILGLPEKQEMELLLPIPEWNYIRQEHMSYQEYFYSLRGNFKMNNSFSCLSGKRKWNYFYLFLKEYS